MKRKEEAGFTLMETMVSLALLLVVSGIVMMGMNQMMSSQGTVANRTEMHASVRGATELLQQEIGQAGRISLPAPGGWVMITPVVPGDFTVAPDVPAPKVVTFSTGTLFDNEQLLVDTGLNQETITLTCVAGPGLCTNQWTATFSNTHAANSPISAPGSFAMGVVPPAAANAAIGFTGFPNGSTGTVLKLFGDVNGDGNMVYIEYTCVPGTPAAPGFLYRNQMAFNAGAKPAVNSSMMVLSNVLVNPNDQNGNPVPCFTYQTQNVGFIPNFGVSALTDTNVKNVYVTDVAVTLTEQTQNADPQTHILQTETKALLNVSPRNVFDAFLLARYDYTNRVQPMPLSMYNNLLYP